MPSSGLGTLMGWVGDIGCRVNRGAGKMKLCKKSHWQTRGDPCPPPVLCAMCTVCTRGTGGAALVNFSSRTRLASSAVTFWANLKDRGKCFTCRNNFCLQTRLHDEKLYKIAVFATKISKID